MVLFVLGGEILARKIKQNTDIVGINFNGMSLKLQQYADDTTFFIKSVHNIDKIFEVLKNFSKASGQKINEDKTQIITYNQKIQTDKILGIYYTQNNRNMNVNWERAINKIVRIKIENEARKVSIFGKLILINSLIISQIIHIARVLPINKGHTQKIKNVIFKFLVGQYKRIEPLKREKLQDEIRNGGINMVDITAKCNALFIEKYKFISNDAHEEFWQKRGLHHMKQKIENLNKTNDSTEIDKIKSFNQT